MRTVTVEGKQVAPSKIVCVGRNYVAHIHELGNEVPQQMVLFLKPNAAISDTLCATRQGEPLHYEGELAFMVTGGVLTAVGFGLDLTRRTLQSELKAAGLPWERAKAFDGAAVFSPFVALPDSLDTLSLELDVDGALRQAGGVELMIHRPPAILDEIAAFTTLEDGDIIMTGTPAGVGEVQAGARFTGRVLHDGRVLVENSWVAQAK